MPSVFISYTQADLASAEALEHGLRAREVVVWRDKTALHAGEKWPKALGEAISQADAVILIWSIAASRSEFVELEWNIAIALKKPVLAILRDDTNLPATLRPLHNLREGELGPSIDRAIDALAHLCSSRMGMESTRGREAILNRLSDISQTDPKLVLESVRSILQQPGWIVNGPVYQAGGDVHIHAPKVAEHSVPRGLMIFVGICVGTLIFGVILKLVFFGSSEPVRPYGRSLDVSLQISGVVTTAADKPIMGAEILVLRTSQTTVTDEKGRFELLVSGHRANDMVRFSITKEGFHPISEFYPLRQDIHVILSSE